MVALKCAFTASLLMIWIYIGRAALIDKVRSILSQRESTADSLYMVGDNQDLCDACADHAAQIVDLIGLLRNHAQLGLFSHTDFRTCSSATIIILLESILNPRLASFSKVRMAMDALGYMATGSDLAQSSLTTVNKFQGVVNKVLSSMYKDDNRSQSLERVSPPKLGESRGVAGAEEFDMSCEYDGNESNMALFQEIDSVLEDCSLTELHLLGFEGLYSSDL